MKRKSNKKPLIALVAVLVVVVIGICIALAVFSGKDSNDTTATTVPTTTKATETTTTAQLENTTVAAATQAQIESTAAPVTTQTQQDSAIPNVAGTTWAHERLINNASIQVTNQSGNTIDFTITYNNENATKIAIAKVSTSLEVTNNNPVTATGTFEYKDSFENTGTGTISVKENVITLVINEEYNNGSGWGIANVTGDYILAQE